MTRSLTFLEAVLAPGQPQLMDEAAAVAAIALARWGRRTPLCPTCGLGTELVHDADQATYRFLCDSYKHSCNVFHGTPLATKRRVSARAMLFALRAMATSHCSISARELGRILEINHVSLWRHLHVLRSILPAPAAVPTESAAAVQVCARTPRTDRDTIPALVVAGARCAVARELGVVSSHTRGAHKRLIGESIRTWLAGTFHGVTARHLERYLREYAARALPPFAIVTAALGALRIPWNAMLAVDHAFSWMR